MIVRLTCRLVLGFVAGINPEDKLPTVGFRVSSYKSGCLDVGPIDHLVHIPDSMKNIAKVCV